MKLFEFILATPKKIIFKGQAYMVVIPGDEGEIGVLAKHSPVITNLKSGYIKIYQNKISDNKKYFINAGVATITPQYCHAMAEKCHS